MYLHILNQFRIQQEWIWIFRLFAIPMRDPNLLRLSEPVSAPRVYTPTKGTVLVHPWQTIASACCRIFHAFYSGGFYLCSLPLLRSPRPLIYSTAFYSSRCAQFPILSPNALRSLPSKLSSSSSFSPPWHISVSSPSSRHSTYNALSSPNALRPARIEPQFLV
jgi:hypothetical protein